MLLRPILQVMLDDVPRRTLLRGIYLETGIQISFAWSSRSFVGTSNFVAEKIYQKYEIFQFYEGIRDVGRRIFIDVYTLQI